MFLIKIFTLKRSKVIKIFYSKISLSETKSYGTKCSDEVTNGRHIGTGY